MKLQVGVKALLTDGMGKYLLLKRSLEAYDGVTEPWDIVGGRIDPDRDLIENLEREISEKTGLRVIGDPVLVAAQDIMSHKTLHVVRLTYLAQASGNKITLSEEHVSYRWLKLEEIESLEGLDSYFRAIFEDVRAAVTAQELKLSGSFTSNIPSNGPSFIGPLNFEKERDIYKDRERTQRSSQDSQNIAAKSKYAPSSFLSSSSSAPSPQLDENFVKLGRGLGNAKNGIANARKGNFCEGGKSEDSNADVEEVARENKSRNHSATQSQANGKARLKAGKIGHLGEDIACRYLEERGYTVVDRNYRKKWGEIDIVARGTNGLWHFVEVKSVARPYTGGADISRATDEYRPEENVHPKKLERLRRVIQTYLLDKRIKDKDWRFSVLAVLLDLKDKKARCRFLKDIVL